MIKKASILLLSILLFSGQAQSDGVTTALIIGALEVRESGYHNLFLYDVIPGSLASNVEFPDEGCDLANISRRSLGVRY